MKSSPDISFRCRRIGLALALAAFAPTLFADHAADTTAAKIDDYRSNNTEMNKAEVKAALAQIDAELKQLDEMADAAPTAQEKADAKLRYQLLKERRNELKKDFNRARYEAFKSELKAEKDKVSAWAKQVFSTKPAASSATSATTAAAEITADKIAEYRADSSALNKAEVKASLERLDADIDLLDAKIESVSDPVRKEELKAHLKALKERRSELNTDFRKARYDAILADVKAEWNKVVH